MRNKVVLIFCENNYETIVAYIGLIKNHSIPYLIDNDLTNEKIIEIYKKYKINYLYLPKKRLGDFRVLQSCSCKITQTQWHNESR